MANGALLNMARADNKFILDQGGFQTDLTITNAKNTFTTTIYASVTLHHTQLDPDTGLFVNAKNGHFVLNTQTLEELGFPVFSSTQRPEDPYLKDAVVDFVDASGKDHKMKCIDVRPSQTFGCVSVILGEYE